MRPEVSPENFGTAAGGNGARGSACSGAINATYDAASRGTADVSADCGSGNAVGNCTE